MMSIHPARGPECWFTVSIQMPVMVMQADPQMRYIFIDQAAQCPIMAILIMLPIMPRIIIPRSMMIQIPNVFCIIMAAVGKEG